MRATQAHANLGPATPPAARINFLAHKTKTKEEREMRNLKMDAGDKKGNYSFVEYIHHL